MRCGSRIPFLPLLALAVALTSVACTNSNPACEEAVVTRLLDECSLVVGRTSLTPCLDFADEGADHVAFHVATCEIVDPGADAECLRTSPCDDVPACIIEDSVVEPQCAAVCIDEQRMCASSCEDTEMTFETCSACLLECERRVQSCFEACPDQPA